MFVPIIFLFIGSCQTAETIGWAIPDSLSLPIDSQMQGVKVTSKISIPIKPVSSLAVQCQAELNAVLADNGDRYNSAYVRAMSKFIDPLLSHLNTTFSHLEFLNAMTLNLGAPIQTTCTSEFHVIHLGNVTMDLKLLKSHLTSLDVLGLQQNVGETKIYENRVHTMVMQGLQILSQVVYDLEIAHQTINQIASGHIPDVLYPTLRKCANGTDFRLISVGGNLIDGLDMTIEAVHVKYARVEVYVPVSYPNSKSLGFDDTQFVTKYGGDFYSLNCDQVPCNAQAFSQECSDAMKKNSCQKITKFCPFAREPAGYYLGENTVAIFHPKVQAFHNINNRINIVTGTVPFSFQASGNIQLEFGGTIVNKQYPGADKVTTTTLKENYDKCFEFLKEIHEILPWYSLKPDKIFNGSIGTLAILAIAILLYILAKFCCCLQTVHRRLMRVLNRHQSRFDVRFQQDPHELASMTPTIERAITRR